MATAFGKKLKAFNMSEIKTITGVSFIIYGASASRKTRCLGTLPGKTCHLSLDYGSTSAIKARDMLGIDSEEPKEFSLTKEAYDYYKEWFNELSTTVFHTETNEEITASYRLTTYVLKFALISYIFNLSYQKVNIIKDDKFAVPLEYVKEAIYIMEIFRTENDKVLALFQKNNKLHKKTDDISIKLQNKIRSNKDKKIARVGALQNIRGLTSSKIEEFIELGLFREEKIDRKTYIFEN